MNASTRPEQSALVEPPESSQVNALALITLSPEKFTAEVYQPFKDQLDTAIDSVRTIDYDIATTAGMATAIKCRATFRDLRIAADKERKARKEPITKIGKLLESGYDQVEARITPIEELFDADIKAEEQRKEDVKLAKIAEERARTDQIRTVIDNIKAAPVRHVASGSADLAKAVEFYLCMPAEESEYEEFADEVKQAIGATLEKLREMGIAAAGKEQAAREAEAARIAEAERLAAERAENARVAAENARIAAEHAAEAQRLAGIAKAQQEAAAAAQREADAKAQAERAEQAKKAAEQQAIIDAQLKAMAEQKAALEAQQAAADARDAAALQKLQDEAKREADHGPALMMNAEFDVARDAAIATEAERVRLQAMTEQAVEDKHQPHATLEVLIDALDAHAERFSAGPGDDEIIDMVASAFDLTRAEAIDRLQAIDFDAAREVVA